MNKENAVNYLEFPSMNIQATKIFFTAVFEWHFIDFGSEYTSFADANINGGFYASNKACATEAGSALVVFYSKNLIKIQQRIETAGGLIIKPIFSFPGGIRFHFMEPGGNELAVWSDNTL